MTKKEAISELTRCADICPTTPLAEACRLVLKAGVKDECCRCKHFEDPTCHVGGCDGGLWEPKEDG